MIPSIKDSQLSREMDFLGMLGHELRNALNAIAMSHAIIDQYPPQNAVEERARVVARRQIAHLTRLVNNLVDVSRFARGKIVLERRRLDLAALLRRVATTVDGQGVRLRQQTLALSLPESPLYVIGDELRLEQSLTHLLEHASAAATEGSQIRATVNAPGDPDTREAVISIGAPAMHVSGEQIDDIFNLFHTTGPRETHVSTSVGIELALVRALIESHGGSVSVRRDPGQQECVYEVRVPSAKGCEEEAPESASLLERGVVL